MLSYKYYLVHKKLDILLFNIMSNNEHLSQIKQVYPPNIYLVHMKHYILKNITLSSLILMRTLLHYIIMMDDKVFSTTPKASSSWHASSSFYLIFAQVSPHSTLIYTLITPRCIGWLGKWASTLGFKRRDGAKWAQP